MRQTYGYIERKRIDEQVNISKADRDTYRRITGLISTTDQNYNKIVMDRYGQFNFHYDLFLNFVVNFSY